mgnify:CR=1 FL=1
MPIATSIVIVRPEHLGSVKKRLSEAEFVARAILRWLQTAAIDYDSADVEFVPSMEIPVDAGGAGKVMHLVDALEDLDDVQNVYANFDVSDEVMAELE